MGDAVLAARGQFVAHLDPAPLQRPAQAVDGGVESADPLLGGRREKQHLHARAASVSR